MVAVVAELLAQVELVEAARVVAALVDLAPQVLITWAAAAAAQVHRVQEQALAASAALVLS